MSNSKVVAAPADTYLVFVNVFDGSVGYTPVLAYDLHTKYETVAMSNYITTAGDAPPLVACEGDPHMGHLVGLMQASGRVYREGELFDNEAAFVAWARKHGAYLKKVVG